MVDKPTDKVQLCITVQCTRQTASKLTDLVETAARFVESTVHDDFYHVEFEEVECDVLRVDVDGTKLYNE